MKIAARLLAVGDYVKTGRKWGSDVYARVTATWICKSTMRVVVTCGNLTFRWDDNEPVQVMRMSAEEI